MKRRVKNVVNYNCQIDVGKLNYEFKPKTSRLMFDKYLNGLQNITLFLILTLFHNNTLYWPTVHIKL